MGEEIIMSTRLWTHGYDIFSPSQSVVGHMYVRRHKPKFWESVHRAFSPGVHNPLQAMVLDRIKYQLGYPESSKDMLESKSLLTAVEQYSMGKERPLSRYLELVGLNMTTKEVTITHWCEEGTVSAQSDFLLVASMSLLDLTPPLLPPFFPFRPSAPTWF
jgi:Glycosyltransferase (GlcNAc)